MSIKTIPEKYQIVFDLRRQGKTLDEIGIVINRSKQRIDQILRYYGGEEIHKQKKRGEFLESAAKHDWEIININVADDLAEIRCRLCNFFTKKVSSYCRVKNGCMLCSYTKKKDAENIGLRFNSWTVLGRGAKMEDGRYKWTCVCDCGTIADVELRNLKSGMSRQCRRCGYKNRGK